MNKIQELEKKMDKMIELMESMSANSNDSLFIGIPEISKRLNIQEQYIRNHLIKQNNLAIIKVDPFKPFLFFVKINNVWYTQRTYYLIQEKRMTAMLGYMESKNEISERRKKFRNAKRLSIKDK
jgi:hypothetical protein